MGPEGRLPRASGTLEGGPGLGSRAGPAQDADQRLSLPLPACTIRTIELTIIDRASLSWLRPLSSECRTRSAALAEPALERRLAGERSWWGARESKAAQRATHGSWQRKV